MPRVRYRPWTLYEEALGFKAVKRVSRGLGLMVFFNTVTLAMLYTKYGRSRHKECDAEYNREYEQKHIEHIEKIASSGPNALEERRTRYSNRNAQHIQTPAIMQSDFLTQGF